MGYKEDLAMSMKKQNDLIVQQVLLQVISVVAESETYDEFRKKMYGIALGYLKDMEKMGVTPGTVDKLTKAVDDKFGGSESDDEGILL
jgi:hypothetical protein